LAASQGRLKGAEKLISSSCVLPGFSPLASVFHDPIRECLLEADVVSGFLRLNPLVFQNLLALCLKFSIERRVLQQIIRRCGLFSAFRHTQIVRELHHSSFDGGGNGNFPTGSSRREPIALKQYKFELRPLATRANQTYLARACRKRAL
jgi:hypothetical protein